ncbi:MAG: aspartate aminotransferase-like enzyme [Planctomycetota bacterium]|jgi:aspartate aminotransferase-like enzyme
MILFITRASRNMTNALTFEVAGPSDEDRICALNYQMFVEEIPQHPPNEAKRLVDQFHDQNTYLVARDGEEIIGMVAMRAERPFSLDAKIDNLDAYLPPHNRICEVRLLGVQAGRRRGPVFAGLLDMIMQIGQQRGYDLAVVSGTTRQLRLYEHMGFIAFGPEVGSKDARYQPMYIAMSAFERDSKAAFARRSRVANTHAPAVGFTPISFLPGPVAIGEQVQAAFAKPAISHRSRPFEQQLTFVQQRLCALTNAPHATLLLGSGTLANEAIAGQISMTHQQGVVVVDGEFGRRLADHATRWSLPFETFERDWGAPWSIDELQQFVSQRPDARWLWITLCETSTGVLRNLDALRAMCAAGNIDLYLDAVSAIGAVPVDLRGVRMASAVSGKALGSFPGMAIVFHDGSVADGHRSLPRYLDLALYEASNGVAFTQSSNLVAALATALQRYESPAPMLETVAMASWLRTELRNLGLRLLLDDDDAGPAVTTIALDAPMHARQLGNQLHQAGFLVSYESNYLVARNWLQICLMGAFTRRNLEALVQTLTKIMQPHERVGLTTNQTGQ